MPKVSVIVPVYNTEKYLGRCLDSLLNQTLEDIEIILVDDHSTDNSLDIMQAYQEKEPRKIKIAQTKQNSGAGAARNVGLELADCNYIGFVDSDDYITPDYYEKLCAACDLTNSDISRTNRKIVLGNLDVSFLGRRTAYDEVTIIDPKKDYHYLIKEQPCVTNKVFKRELIGETRFPEDLKWEDYPFTIPLLLKANSIATVPGQNYFYNMHLSSTTVSDARKLSDRVLDIFTCADIIGENCLTEELDPKMIAQINYLQIQNCLGRLKEIVNANIPISEKRQLLTLISELIKTKYGPWQDHPSYQEEKLANPVHRLRMGLVEKALLPADDIPNDETTLKTLIKAKLQKCTKQQ